MTQHDPSGAVDRRSFLTSSAAIAAGLALPSSTLLGRLARDVDPADTVLLGGQIPSLADGLQDATGLAISGGRVVARGDDALVKARIGPETRVLDLKGRTVIPGIEDSHTHVVRGGRFYNLETRWEGVRTLARGLEMIREQAGRTPAGHWVRVIGGWSPWQFTERRLPTIADLNAAGGDVPVFVLYLYSKAYINAAGVRRLGLHKRTPVPEGARIEFVDGGAVLHAEPNPTLLYQTIGKLPHLETEDQLNGTKRFFRELNRLGLTSAVDAGGGGHRYPQDYLASKTLGQRGEIPLRVAYYLFPQRKGKEYQDFRAWARRQRVGTQLAARLDGLVLRGGGEFLVWSGGDFENFMAPRPTQGPEMEKELYRVARHLVEIRWPIRIHATYDESIERILNVFERIDEEVGFRSLRWAVDHAETISDRNIARVKALGGGVAVQNRMAFAGEEFLARYGEKQTRQTPPLRKLLEAGIPLGLGTDATRVSSYDPWESIHWAITGRSIGDTQLIGEEQCLTRKEALNLMTQGSAWFSGSEDGKGSLAVGHLADLAVLDRDVMKVPDAELRGTRSLLTMVGGEPVHAEGAFASHDPGEAPTATPDWSPERFGAPLRERG